ncbi:GNAT family N-acetyltransferase [Sedimentibacter sp. MB31-C6]|uniref:GNAT family N-acetyltransferase n=1 Tax=Sedimentibacter sp. MB31-C6 TaxID=3109366 RepID=UPI002DDD8647|nr:GNAT family N-acetyltransferase [Sedimentibacter sp. MB36-C1]WSI04568.1 GNAT family N-acetyltransferase [Sedimentibacter sp. MB36-C1]
MSKSVILREVKLKNGYNLILKKAEVEDAPKMIEYLNIIGGQSDNLLFGKNEFHLNIEQEKEYLKNLSNTPNTLMLLGLIDNRLVSTAQISASSRKRISHNSEIAISVLKDYWHIGIGTAVMEELINFAKSTATIRNVTLGVRKGNDNAIKLYEKLGFIKVGEHKDFFNIDGKFYDEILMEMYI